MSSDLLRQQLSRISDSLDRKLHARKAEAGSASLTAPQGATVKSASVKSKTKAYSAASSLVGNKKAEKNKTQSYLERARKGIEDDKVRRENILRALTVDPKRQSRKVRAKLTNTSRK